MQCHSRLVLYLKRLLSALYHAGAFFFDKVRRSSGVGLSLKEFPTICARFGNATAEIAPQILAKRPLVLPGIGSTLLPRRGYPVAGTSAS